MRVRGEISLLTECRRDVGLMNILEMTEHDLREEHFHRILVIPRQVTTPMAFMEQSGVSRFVSTRKTRPCRLVMNGFPCNVNATPTYTTTHTNQCKVDYSKQRLLPGLKVLPLIYKQPT
jgi:hypothetical protein